MQRPYIISIEGNIGSGKTTLISRLEELLPNSHDSDGKKYVFLREPVPVWESVQDPSTGENILQKYYGDQSKYAFPFQVLAYMSFYKQLTDAIKNAGENTVIICERSMQSSRAIFAKMLKDDGIIEEMNYQVLEMFYGQTVEIQLDAIIYLDVDVATCNERINKRDRPGEGNIPLEYLEKCGKYHDDWLQTVTFPSSSIQFLQLKCSIKEKSEQNVDFDRFPGENCREMSESDMVTKIASFIESVYPTYIGPCSGCNFRNIMYSNDQHWILCKGEQTRILCRKCFGDCWTDAHKDGWSWYDDVTYTGEEYETY